MNKCAECGFLTLRNRFSGELDEVDGDFRKTGNPPRRRAVGPRAPAATIPVISMAPPGVTTGEIWPYPSMPICFVQRYDLWQETHLTERTEDVPASMVLEIISKERDCVPSVGQLGFTAWRQGFTPKEHREMMDREAMQRLQFEREEADRRWRREERYWRIGELLMIIFGGVVAAVVGALIARS